MQTKEQTAITLCIHRDINSEQDSIRKFEEGIKYYQERIIGLKSKLSCPHQRVETCKFEEQEYYVCMDCGRRGYPYVLN